MALQDVERPLKIAVPRPARIVIPRPQAEESAFALAITADSSLCSE
jgi:hypothetical protein